MRTMFVFVFVFLFFVVFLQFDPSFFTPFSPPFFVCLFLSILYAGPFEPHLIDVDGAALRRYNGKPNILGSKIRPFFSYF